MGWKGPAGLALVAVFAIAATTLSMAHNASALGPVTVEAGAVVGGATNTQNGEPNPFGFEFGGRAGASLWNVYLGVSFLYSLGSSETDRCVLPGGYSCGTFPVADRAVRYGLAGGYDLHFFDRVTLRPQLGIGDAVTYLSDRSSEPPAAPAVTFPHQHDLYLEPGLTALASLGRLFVGADVNALWLPGSKGSNVALSAHGQVGIQF